MNEEEMYLEQANMYLNGMSFREIAKVVGVSHITVRDNITRKIKNIAPNIYLQVLNKIEENTEKTIDDLEVKERVLDAYRLLVEENKTILEIANDLNSTEFTIYRDLTKRLESLHEKSPELVTDIMLKKAKIVLQKHAFLNLMNKHKKSDINEIYDMYPNETKRYRFIARCVLTFGLRPKTLEEIFSIDSKVLSNNIIKSYSEKRLNIIIVFEHGMKDQEKAKEAFLNYFDRLCKAYKNQNQDQEKAKEILEEISDKDAVTFLKNHKAGDILSEDDILMLIKFQIKYMLDTLTIETTFNVSRKQYTKRVRELEDKYPELVSDFDYICDYYHNLALKKYYVGR